MMHWYNHCSSGGTWMGWIWWILISAAILTVVWYLVAVSHGGRGGSADSPERTLKRRYANGELDRETFERMLADLRR